MARNEARKHMQQSKITKVPGAPAYMSPQMFTDHYTHKGTLIE